MAEQSQSQAEIEIAVTAKMEQLQMTLAKAEAAQKVNASKMEVIEAKKAQAAEKVAQQIAVIEQKKAAQIEVMQAKQAQRDADTAAKATVLAQRQAQKAIEIEQKKAATIDTLRMKQQQRDQAMAQREAAAQQKKAQAQLAQQQASAGGGVVNPFGGFGAIAKGVGALAITNMLLDSTLEGVKRFNQGGGAGAFADAFIDTLDASIRSVPLAGTIYAITEEIFYGAERAAEERRNKQLANQRERGAASQEFVERAKKEADALVKQRETLYASNDDAEVALFRSEEFRARDRKKQMEDLMKTREGLIYQIQNGDDIQRTAAVAELQALDEQARALRELAELEADVYKSKISRVRVERQIAAGLEHEEKIKQQAQEAEKKRLDDIAKKEQAKEQAMRDAADAALAAKQAEIDALDAVSPVDRQAQMMASAQQSAASMIGSASTALGEFKFAAKGVGELALAEAKKQTEKQMKIEQLQADMKRIQEDLLREVKLNKGVA